MNAQAQPPGAMLAWERISVRAFLPTEVPDEVLHQVLATARQAPSGANLQPGSLVRVRGAPREELSTRLVQAWRSGLGEAEDYDYFPNPMPMSLRRRQVAAAQALYGALGIRRDDKAGRDEHFARNFRFFDAPVALIVTIDQRFGPGGYMDLGMMLYGLMLAAQAQGLASCAIGALASYARLIRELLAIDACDNVVCGLALGYADPHAPVNQTRTARSELQEFFHVVG